MLDTRDLLTILMLKNVGRKTVQKLLPLSQQASLSSEQIVDLFIEARSSGVKARLPTESEVLGAQANADRAISIAPSIGISIVGYNDRGFPARLKNTPDPPVLLYIKGDQSCLLGELSVAVIGTRKASVQVLDLADRFTRHLVSRGATIVSGLALGCDSAAHTACIEMGGRTVAVMAHGLDRVYPASNAPIADGIIQNGGCLVSEYPVGVPPQKQAFIERDRIQSGLSDGVLVIQTSLSGGTMHTVRYAKSQERPVSAVQFEDGPSENQAEGNSHLIESGEAMPIEDEADLDAFLLVVSQSIESWHLRDINEDNPAKDSEGQMKLFGH